MRSTTILSTVLLASAITIKDIDCLPVGSTVSRLGPQAKHAVKLATGANGRSMSSSSSSYHGPIMPSTNKEAVALVDAKEGHHKVTQLRHDGQ